MSRKQLVHPRDEVSTSGFLPGTQKENILRYEWNFELYRSFIITG